MIYPDCDMKKWEYCDNSVILANANYYYTKQEVDEIVDDIEGMDEEEVQRMINRSIRTKADKTDVIALSGQVQDNADAILNTYTKAETNALFTPYSTTAQMNDAIDSATSRKADSSAVTQVNNALTAHTADTSVHTTSAEKTYWNNKLDASAYTPTDLSNYYTKGQTDGLLDEKLDASAYTPTDLSNYYTKGQTDGLLDEKLDASAYTPTDLSNYYTKSETDGVVDEAVSGKADTTYVNQIATQATSAITELNTRIGTVETTLGGQIETLNANKFGYASYDSQTQRINFYSHSNSQDVLAYVDASAFIKDGMVSNVEIINGNLVITFNSDAGKQPISIPLTDIFNPANYYTTAQTQSYVSGFTYDKETIDQKVASGGTFDPDLYYDKTATDALLAAKADTASTYTKTEVDAALSGKADTSAVTAVANDVQTVSGQVATKVATSDFNTYTAATASAIGNKQDALEYYSENTEDGYAEILITNDDGEGSTEDNHINIGGGVAEIGIYNEYDDGQGNVTANNASIYADQIMVTLQAGVTENGDTTSTELMVDANGVTINGDAVATEPYVDAATSGKADTSAVTAVNDALTAHTANTSVHVTSAEKAEWDGKAEVVELTQAQYDALSGQTDPDVLYVISDATAADISNYWTSAQTQSAITKAVSGKVDTSAITTTITSGSTDSEIPTAKAVYDATQGGGGGATYSAGYGINIDTANTISFNMPITCTTNSNDNITIGNGTNNANWSLLVGNDMSITNSSSSIGLCVSDQSVGGSSISGNTRGILIGCQNTIKGGNISVGGGVAIGDRNQSTDGGIVIGTNSKASGSSTVAIGLSANATGTTKMNLNNQIKVDTNNQVYIKDKDNVNEVCIQDAIAALGGLKLVSLTQSEYDQLATKDANTLYIINNVV